MVSSVRGDAPESVVYPPSGPQPPLSNLVTAISFARFAALVTGLLGGVGVLVLLLRVEYRAEGPVRPYVGQGLVAGALTFALVIVLLFLAAFAETWRATHSADG